MPLIKLLTYLKLTQDPSFKYMSKFYKSYGIATGLFYVYSIFIFKYYEFNLIPSIFNVFILKINFFISCKWNCHMLLTGFSV